MFAYLYFISLTIFKKKQVKLCKKFWNYVEKKRKESIVETFKKGKREKGYWALRIPLAPSPFYHLLNIIYPYKRKVQGCAH